MTISSPEGTSNRGNTIRDCYIGTDPFGTEAEGNGDGIAINGAPDNNIFLNVISGNAEHGILIQSSSATNNLVVGNKIGTNAAGTAPLANKVGVRIAFGASNNTIGGTTIGAGNVISGNTQEGIWIDGATDNVVEGNFIGTNVDGTAALGNTSTGVLIDGAFRNTIGGATLEAENVISGNQTSGIRIQGSGATLNVVQGNLIGTDSTGTTALGSDNGVEIINAPANTIGGTTPEERNVISGNSAIGVRIKTDVNLILEGGEGSRGNVVEGNFIGTNGDGTAALGNAIGVAIIDSSANRIGGGDS